MSVEEYRDRLGQRFVERLDKYYKRIETIEELKEFAYADAQIAVYFPATIKPYGNIVLDQTKEGRTENIEFYYQNMCVQFHYITCFQQIHAFEQTKYAESAESKESKDRLVKLLKRMMQ